MHAKQGRYVALLAVTAMFAAGCARVMNRNIETCAKFATGSWQPYDSTLSELLVGRFRLIMISEAPNSFDRTTSGSIELWTVDSAQRFIPNPVRTGETVDRGILWGAANIGGGGIALPWARDPGSRDPGNPGVVVNANGVLELGAIVPPRTSTDSNSVTLTIERMSRDGFSGLWKGEWGASPKLDKHGNVEPEPRGRYCALRRK